MKTSSEIMKNILITLSLVALSCSIATAQWTKVYQTDSCSCILGHSQLAGMGFFGNDSGLVCSEGGGGVTAVTLDGGLTWDTSSIDPSAIEDIRPPSYDYGTNSCFLDVNHIWFCNGMAVCHTNNAGKTWMVDTNRDSLEYAKCICFVDSLVGFEGGGQALMVFRTSDGGRNWNRVQTPEVNDPVGSYAVYQIQFATPKFGLAICAELYAIMMRTTDSGMTWVATTGLLSSGFGQPVCLSYPDPRNAWFTDGFHILHSSDSGLNWTTVCGEIAPQSVFSSISFVDSLHGIATASSGLSLTIGYTSDGGQIWQTTSIDSEANDGNASLTSFPDTNTAYAGGFGAVYKLNVGDLEVQQPSSVNSNLQIYPNPFSQSTQITFSSQAAGYAEVSIVNMLGVEVARLFSGELGAGEHSFSWSNPTGLPDGTYECLVRMNGKVQTLPVALLR